MIAKFSVIYGVCAAVFAAGAWVFGGALWALNAFAASVGAYAVVIGSFWTYKRMIGGAGENAGETVKDAKSAKENGENEESEEEAEEAENNAPQTRAKFAFASFAPRRILGYALLVISFALLHTNGVFLPLAYLIGLLVLPISAFIFAGVSAKGTTVAK